jgi:tetratricopeptide (TPR) repeat protein
MFARTWHIRWMAMGVGVLMAAGCGSPKGGAVSKGPRQVTSKLPVAVPEAPELPQPEILPDTYVAAGRLHESQGRLARAAEQYRLAIGAKPNCIEAYSRLGVVLDRMGKFNEADQCFARGIQFSPRLAHLHNNLGFSYLMQGRWAEAQRELNKAIELQPEFPRARVNLGTALAQQGRFQEAFESFRQALRAEDAYYNIGLMYQSKKQPVQAAQAFKEALAANPKMMAAQKRLDLLPPSVVSEAEKQGTLFVFPAALNGQRPTDVPAVRPGPPESVAAIEDEDVLPAAAQPEEQVEQDDLALPDEGNGIMGWQFSNLFPDTPDAFMPAEEDGSEEQVVTPADSDVLGMLAHPAEMIRLAIEPVGALLDGILAADMDDMTELASPLPVMVAHPQPEELPFFKLMVTPSTQPAP